MNNNYCGYVMPRNFGCHPIDINGCILPEGHEGPHKFKCDAGKYWWWEMDYECDCCIDEEEWSCCIYWEDKDGR
jgi:hypothetical protein